MPTTRAVSAPQPTALFEACLRGNPSLVARLLKGPDAGTLQREGPGGLTLLHAAVLGGATAALPLLVADGAPLDAEFGDTRQQRGDARAFLESLGSRMHDLVDGSTALELAVRKRDGAAVEQLLQLGASIGWSLHALLSICPTSAAGAERVIGPFLRRGIDPLQPGCLEPLCSGSLLMELDSSHVRYGSRAAADTAHVRRYLLDHLQALNAAGQLQLDCKPRAADLVMGAASCGHPLLPVGIMALEECFGAAEGAAAPDPGSQDAQLLEEVLRSVAHAAETTPLAALLASSLPLPLHMRVRHSWLHVSLLADTALSRTAHPGNCRLLHQAGAPLTADDLYACNDALSHKGVAAVLACGALAVDTSQPVNQAPELFYSCLPGYSCPIHRTLHTLTQARRDFPWESMYRAERAALCILDALLPAGFLSCTWQTVHMPEFLQPQFQQPARWDTVLPLLDPFNLYSPQHSAALGLQIARCYVDKGYWLEDRVLNLSDRVLFVARGGSWSPQAHRHWPERFKAIARVLLLATHAAAGRHQGPTRASRKRRPAAASGGTASSSSSSSGPAGCCLGDLPHEVLLHILRLAAMPLSSWLSPRPDGSVA